jgi:hypothetical protein
MRYAKKRDHNDMEIFRALEVAGANPVRCTDFDIGAEHALGWGVMLEVKTAKGQLRALQETLQRIFKDRYHVVRSAEQALAACGRLA